MSCTNTRKPRHFPIFALMCITGSTCAGSPQVPSECTQYRDTTGEVSVAISIRNERTEAIFLKPFDEDCNDVPRLVDWDALNVRGYSCAISCEDILESPDNYPIGCTGACATASVVRLEPGETYDAGTVDSYYRGHGVSFESEGMPGACQPGNSEEEYSCFSRRALLAGPYTLTVQAIVDYQCPPIEGSESCLTEGGLPSDLSDLLEIKEVTVEATVIAAEGSSIELVFGE